MRLMNVFTEEGRTRTKNALRRYSLYAFAWLAASLVAGYGTYALYVGRNLTPMQRVYFNQYATSAWRTTLRRHLPLVAKSNYMILVRETYDAEAKRPQLFAVTEDDAIAILDQKGYVARNAKGLPIFALKDGVERTRFYWRETFDSDARRYEFFRVAVYEGQSFMKMLSPSLAAALGLFIFGLGMTMAFDLSQNRRYLRGELLRGPQRLTPREYARHFRTDGLGIRILSTESA